MKILNKFLLVFLLAFAFAGCEDYIGGDLNEDPNNPTDVPIFAQLPAFQVAMADNYGGDFSRINSLLVQQVEGVARQWVAFNQYTGLTPNRFDDAWQNTYEKTLNEIKLARVSAVENGYNHYLGVLNVCEAFTLMMATDVWDDMPYTDALNGLESINPAYDTQASIYATIYSLLDEAVNLFAGPSGTVFPGGDDIFYGGDTDAWTMAAHAIKARGLIKDKDYAGASAEASKSFTSADDNMAFNYPDANSAGQWYRFNRDRTGDIEFSPSMRALMTGLNDTMRLKQFDYPFIIPATNEPGHPYMIAAFNQEMITYREMQFIIAEADVRANTGGTAAGHTAYLAGIKASFDRLGLPQADYDAYVTQPEVDPTMGLTLDMVMTQKYIAMFLQPEAYSDWRRTGIPALSPTSGSAIPVRWHYASDEYLFNSNSPSEGDVDIFTNRVGWNK